MLRLLHDDHLLDLPLPTRPPQRRLLVVQRHQLKMSRAKVTRRPFRARGRAPWRSAELGQARPTRGEGAAHAERRLGLGELQPVEPGRAQPLLLHRLEVERGESELLDVLALDLRDARRACSSHHVNATPSFDPSLHSSMSSASPSTSDVDADAAAAAAAPCLRPPLASLPPPPPRAPPPPAPPGPRAPWRARSTPTSWRSPRRRARAARARRRGGERRRPRVGRRCRARRRRPSRALSFAPVPPLPAQLDRRRDAPASAIAAAVGGVVAGDAEGSAPAASSWT